MQVHAFDLVDLVERLVAAGRQRGVRDRHLSEADVPQVLHLGRQHDPAEKRLEVVYVPHLTWLAYAFAVRESLEAEKLGGLIDLPIEAQVHQQTDDRRASPALSRIAVHDKYVLWVFLEPAFHCLHQLHKHMKRRGVVVLPIKCGNSAVESLWFILFLRAVEYVIFLAMSFF